MMAVDWRTQPDCVLGWEDEDEDIGVGWGLNETPKMYVHRSVFVFVVCLPWITMAAKRAIFAPESFGKI